MATNTPEPVLVHLGEEDPGTVALKRTFSGNFWGEKCKGYGVLLRNLKSGSSVSGHLADYLKERASLEKAYLTGLQKLHKSLQQINDAHLGSFYPMWVLLMKSVEERFTLHEQYLTQLTNIAKDVSDYGSKLDDRLKQNLKGEIDNAGKSLKTFARTINTIAKTKKTYEHSCEDVIDQTRELARMKRLEGTKPKDIEKMEAKLKKSRAHLEQTQADHVKSIEQHKIRLEEYKECMAKACTKFQLLEEEHMSQLMSFVTVIAQADEGKYSKLQQEANKNMAKIGGLSIQQLINIFSQTRGTGTTKPTPYRFREVDLEAMISAGPRSDLAPIKTKRLRPKKAPKESRGIRKTLERGKRLPEPKADGVNGVTEGTPTPHEDSPEVDEEGYSIRPTDADKVAKFLDDASSQTSSSDSDFDSDDEPEFRLRKIKIKDIAVKPDEGNINDLMGAAAKLSLDAPPPSSGMKKATSSQSLKANITSMIVRAPSPVGSQSLFEGASGPQNNSPSPAGSVDTEVSQQSIITFSLGNFSLPEPILPTLPAHSDLGSTDLSAPLPSASGSWASFDSPSPLTSDPACDTSAPDPMQPLALNWAESSLGKQDSGASQEEGPKSATQPVPVRPQSPDLDPLPKTQSSPALLKVASGEAKKDAKFASLSGPTLLPPPSSSRVSKRRSKISLGSHKPSSLLSSVAPPAGAAAFAGQTPLEPIANVPGASKLSSDSLSSHSESAVDKTATLATNSTADKAATPTANHTSSLQSTLSPVLVPKPYNQGNESPVSQGKAPEPPPAASASFSSTPVTTPNASPVLNPVRTAGAALSPLANVSISNAPSQSLRGGVVIPIAVAIHETCNAIFKGSKSIVKVTGEVMFSFPLGYVSQFASHAPLRFVVSEASMVTRLIHNQNYLIKEKDDAFVFQMEKLSVYLKQFLQNQSAHVQFCNLPALKYDMSFGDVSKLPLQLSCSWKCDSTSTNYQLNLTYAASHLPLSPKPPLSNVTATISVDGGVTSSQSSPSGLWSQEHGKLLWNVGEMRPVENPVPVTLQSKFELSSGPSTPKPAIVQFICDGSTLSGLRLKLDTPAYKVSLYKNKLIAGKYMVEQVQET